MRKMLLVLITMYMTMTFIACESGGESSQSATSTVKNTTSGSEPYTSMNEPGDSDMTDNNAKASYPLEETERDFVAFEAFRKNLKVESVGKLRMEYHGGMTSTICETSDPEIISRWVDLVKRMQLTAQPGPSPEGAATVLYVIIDGTEGFLGSYIGSNVVITNAAMGKIENYDEVSEKFETLRKEMMDKYKVNYTEFN